MKLKKELENKIKEKVIPYLEKARKNWDVPHTLATVYWMKQLLKVEIGNKKILITTMYLHDIGGAGLFKKKYSHESGEKLKIKQMQKGKLISKKILKELTKFTKEEIEQITNLVYTHDNLSEIVKTNDGQLVFEADSLGQIDRKRAKPTFSKEEYNKFLKYFKKERASRFKTKIGKKYLKELFKDANKYFI